MELIKQKISKALKTLVFCCVKLSLWFFLPFQMSHKSGKYYKFVSVASVKRGLEQRREVFRS